VSFKTAVGNTRHLADAWKPGLQALRAQDRPHVVPVDPRRLQGSVDVDSALRSRQPNANRWDFAIAYRHTNNQKDFIYWTEVHTAADKEVKVVLKKLNWLRKWLKGDGSLLNAFDREFVWVSSGATMFTLDAPQRKQFAELGLTHQGRVLRIPSERPK
jgi:hypothetical protein